MSELGLKAKTLFTQARAAEARLPSNREKAYAALCERLAAPPTLGPGGAGHAARALGTGTIGKLIVGTMILVAGAGGAGLWSINARHNASHEVMPVINAVAEPAQVSAGRDVEFALDKVQLVKPLPTPTPSERPTRPPVQANRRRQISRSERSTDQPLSGVFDESPVVPEPTQPSETEVTAVGEKPQERNESAPILSPQAVSNPGPAPIVMPSSLNAEIELLREAQLKVQSGNGRAALALLDHHRALYPAGVLNQEREAARILALCLLGRTPEAQREADAFARQWPRSPQLGRVRASCVGSTTTGQGPKDP